jgi:hypothetical protein
LLATFVLSVVFGTGFGRALCGSRLAGLLVGLGIAVLPIRMETLYELNNLSTMWLALASWALVRWHETHAWRWIWIGVAALHLQFLSSIQLLFHFLVLAGLWLSWLWARSRFAITRPVVVQAVAAVGVSALLLWPWARLYAEVSPYLPAARSLEEMLMYRPPLADWWGRLWPGDVLVPLFLLALVLWVVFTLRRRPLADLAGGLHLGPLVLLALAGAVLSQGPLFPVEHGTVRLPYYGLMQALPFLQTIRAPQRMQRVVCLFAAGAAGVALTWLLGHVTVVATRLAQRWPGAGARLAPHLRAATGLSLLALLLLRAAPAQEGTRPLPQPPWAAALRALPADAVVCPVPLALNWPDRPPLDYIAIRERVRFLGGYGGAIPDAFWVLARELSDFPAATALDAVRAAGATHLLVDRTALGPSPRHALAAAERAGSLHRLAGDPAWELIALSAPPLPRFDPFATAAAQWRLAGPSTVAAGQRLTVALYPASAETRFDPVIRREVVVELLAAGRLVGLQRGVLRSPHVIEPGGFPYQLTFTAPDEAGAFRARVLWPPCPPCRDRDTLAADLVVRGDLETSTDRPVVSADLGEAAAAPPVTRGQSARLRLRLGNRDPHLWLARSEVELPHSRGAIIPHVTLLGPRPTHLVLVPWQGQALLPFDLGPGDTVETVLRVPTPAVPGLYRVQVKLGAHALENPKSRNVILESPLTVE